jgi:hypothetical protein
MELTLNLICHLICLAASTAWMLTYQPSVHKCSRNQGLLLLICISIILFPVISITDDLQEATAYTEDHLARPQDIVKKAIRLAAVTPQQSLLTFLCVCFALGLAERRSLKIFIRVSAPAITLLRNISFAPAVEKRPPPMFAHSL